MITDTPRTDDALITERNGCIVTFQGREVVPASFACELERENVAATSILARWLEWARAHGHLEHAAGIVADTRAMLIGNPGGWPKREIVWERRGTDGTLEGTTRIQT
jgi:hypothetical protein